MDTSRSPKALRQLLCLSMALLLSTLASGQASTVSGTAQYQDRTYNMNGFLGVQTFLPARFCRVEVVDAAGNVFGSGETNATGQFTFTFVDPISIGVQVRMLAQSTSRNIRIQDSSTNGNPIWAQQVGALTVNPPNNWNVGTVQATTINDPTGGGRVGSPFNLLDEALNAMAFLGQQVNLGNPPTIGQTVNIRWPRNTGNTGGSFYTPGTANIQMGNVSAYDDTILHHEFGHVVHNFFGDSDNPGGPHFFCGGGQNPALSWAEAWATFWGSNVMQSVGVADPGIYVNSTGQAGAGALSFSYRLEDASNAAGNPLCVVPTAGIQDELAIQCALWDLTDVPGDNPNNPLDDDPYDGTVFPGGLTPWVAQWDVFTNYMLHPGSGGTIPNNQPLIFDHFWDGWFVRGYMNNAAAVDYFVATNATWGISRDIWVDAAATGTADGTSANPYPTVSQGFGAAPSGATLRVIPGAYPESPILTGKYVTVSHGGGAGVPVVSGG
ncbi:MAG: hypothetical protein QF724_05400 [Planctomycetota bacterium]|nr:hypothetical protein [Planctomycetota bacterium]MDP6838355.1 hypothetical protein [Planctomycetota bacterium]